MAEIIINEVSQNYSYNIGTNSFAVVALPITACWGPGLEASVPKDLDGDAGETKLEELKWTRFPATQTGLETFVATYRGPASIYRTIKDYSYQAAVSLLSAGYDVLVCRVAPGAKAQGILTAGDQGFAVTAKYAGTFGNNLRIVATVKNNVYNIITYVVDNYGSQTALENLLFVIDETLVTDTIPYIDELESKYIDIVLATNGTETPSDVRLGGGTDYAADEDTITVENFRNWYHYRYAKAYPTETASAETGFALLKYETDNTTEAYNGLRFTAFSDGAEVKGGTGIHVTLNTDVESIENQKLFTVTIESGLGTETIKFYIDNPESTTPVYTYHYEAVVGDTAPTWTADTYYELDGTFYTLTTSEPADWSTNYTDYYTRGDVSETYIPLSTVTSEYVAIVVDNSTEAVTNSVIHAELTAALDSTIVHPSYDVSEYGAKILSIDEATLTPFMFYRQSIYSMAYIAYNALTDKLTYNFQRVIAPGWDDQDISEFGATFERTPILSALHIKLMQIGYYSRCGTAYLDVPKALPRRFVSIPDGEGYAQKLARYQPENAALDVNISLYPTHSALFAPWGQYTYVGTSKQVVASPSFLALLIQRAMILNQSIQYEWCLPTNRSHNLRLGKFDYTIPAHLLKEWQSETGVGINCLTSLPDLGNTLWGNSTLFEIPPATYQALENLSTRFLVNAIEDIVYRCGIAITFQYNNGQAYDKFYAGVTPLLDTMKNVGAISDYYVTMSADINGLDQVNANSVIGKIYITPVGVITSIAVDLIALPPQTDLAQFAE